MDTKEYIDKEKLLSIVDQALFQIKAYDGGVDSETAIRILNNLKVMVKTMESIKINNKGEIVNG